VQYVNFQIELSDTAPKQVGNKQHLLEEDPQMDVNIQLSKQRIFSYLKCKYNYFKITKI
jgi:hypothetical protein